MSRLTRRDMKRDEVIEGVRSAVEYTQGHVRTMIWVGVAVLVGLGAWFAVTAYMSAQEGKADVRLSAAIALLMESSETPGGGEQARMEAGVIFEEVRDEFGGTPAARIAEAYLGSLALQAGDRDAARRHWESFLETASNDALAAEVWMNLIRLDREDGLEASLVPRLETMLAARTRPLPEDLLLAELARSLSAVGRHEEARDLYQRIVDEFPGSPHADAARRAIGPSAVSLG